MLYIEHTNEKIEYTNELQAASFNKNSPGSIDVYRPRSALSIFLWNSVSSSLLNFIHCGRLLETCTLSISSPKHSDMSTLSKANKS